MGNLTDGVPVQEHAADRMTSLLRGAVAIRVFWPMLMEPLGWTGRDSVFRGTGRRPRIARRPGGRGCTKTMRLRHWGRRVVGRRIL
jgi:hypothetical protein